MNRTGCNPSEVGGVLKMLDPENIRGVYSHLFAAENSEASYTQLNLFKSAVREVKAVNKNAVAHISASGGILRGGDGANGGKGGAGGIGGSGGSGGYGTITFVPYRGSSGSRGRNGAHGNDGSAAIDGTLKQLSNFKQTN